jgi:flagellar hook-associated protein 1 FlgK
VNSAAAAGQRVAANVNNNPASPVSLEVQISNVAELTDDEYQLDYDGGTSTWTLRNLNDRSLVTSFPEPAAAPALIPVPGEGFSINFTAIGALGGESYRIQPVRNGADELGVVIQDPQDIAAASPIRTQTALDNIGTGIIGAGEVTDTTNATFTTTAQALTPPLEINFISSTEYEILDSTTGLPVDALNPTYNNYVPGQTNDILALAGLNYGYSFTISGEPVSGDTFTVGYNTDGVGDNRNIVALAALQTTKTLDNGTTNYQESYGRLVSEVGAKTEEAKINAKTAEALREQAQQRRDSVSAVNLDEEAANLIKFQQAYQANARVLSTVQQLIDVLFAAVQ